MGLSGMQRRWVNMRRSLVSKECSHSLRWSGETDGGKEGEKEVQGCRSAGHVKPSNADADAKHAVRSGNPIARVVGYHDRHTTW